LPAGAALPAEKTPELLGLYYDEGQQGYFDLGRSAVLSIGGLAEMLEGAGIMVASAPPTVVGGGTFWTGAGALVFAGGAALEVVGAATIADGIADTAVGVLVLRKSGVYVLVGRGNVIRYVGKSKCLSDRECAQKASKPKHVFKKYFDDIRDPDVRTGAEQWLMEHCPTCSTDNGGWNKISGMSPWNKKFDMRVIKFIEWHLKKFGTMPPLLIQ
jgi:hypothetical protein